MDVILPVVVVLALVVLLYEDCLSVDGLVVDDEGSLAHVVLVFLPVSSLTVDGLVFHDVGSLFVGLILSDMNQIVLASLVFRSID